MLTSQDVNEMADAQPGVVQAAVTLSKGQSQRDSSTQESITLPTTTKAPKMSTASIGSDGKVNFDPIGESRISS